MTAATKLTTQPPHNNNKKRLVLAVYRSLMRWCQDIPDETLPLDDFIPPLRDQVVIDNVKVFRQVLRESFREEVSYTAGKRQLTLTERIQVGLDGWRQLNQLHPEIMAFYRQWGASIRQQQQAKQQQQQQQQQHTLKEQDRQKVAAYFDTITGGYSASANATNLLGDDENNSSSDGYNEREWVQQKIDAVPWLPKIEDCEIRSLELEDENTKFPLFPLASGPLFHSDILSPSHDDAGDQQSILPLPLFTPQRETPVPGAEVPLKIFEPRYRQLYSDLQQSVRRQMIIPFPHPLELDTFASVALVHHLTNLQEVADETNGQILFLADHVVVSCVEIEHILNPHVWATQQTYLQVQARYMADDNDKSNVAAAEGGVYEPLMAALKEWKAESSHPLATKSLLALQEHERVWDLVQVWNTHFQQELFQLQLAVHTQVRRLNASKSPPVFGIPRKGGNGFLEGGVVKAQEPHRRRLVQLMMETSLLVPTLLTMNDAEKCKYLVNMVRQERTYLKSNSF